MRPVSGVHCIVVTGLTGLLGCSPSHEATADAGDDASDTVACVPEGGIYQVDTYAPHLLSPGRHGVLVFELVQADPAPPAQGYNSFVLKVTHADGSPFSGSLDFLQPFPQGVFMPLHNHGPTAPIPVVDFDRSTGTFALTQMNFFMPGLWRVTVNAFEGVDPTDAGAASDDGGSSSTATPTDVGQFYFCIN